MNCVDVVIPCYNYGRFLSLCVESVLNQEGVSVRILIIDDCSNDDTESVGKALAEKDSRVHFRRHAANCGHIATYNEGMLGWASAEYSLLLSADDILTPGSLSRATGFLEGHRELGMTYGLALRIEGDETTLPLSVEHLSNQRRIITSSEFLKPCFTHGNRLETATAVVRTELQHRLGGYRGDLPYSGDMEMWMRFAANAPVGVIHAVQAFVRMHGNNMRCEYYENILRDHREVIKACEQFLSEWGDRFPDAQNWHKMMRRRMSEDAYWAANAAFEKGNKKEFQKYLEFAKQVYPDISSSKLWRRIQMKSFFGTAIWRKIKPVWNRLRGNSKTWPDSKVAAPTATATAGLSGWCPGADNAES